MNGADWKSDYNWLDPKEPTREWYGVTTDRDGAVTELSPLRPQRTSGGDRFIPGSVTVARSFADGAGTPANPG